MISVRFIRFIPNDMEFDEKAKDVVTDIPDTVSYKPTLFNCKALNQSQVWHTRVTHVFSVAILSPTFEMFWGSSAGCVPFLFGRSSWLGMRLTRDDKSFSRESSTKTIWRRWTWRIIWLDPVPRGKKVGIEILWYFPSCPGTLVNHFLSQKETHLSNMNQLFLGRARL